MTYAPPGILLDFLYFFHEGHNISDIFVSFFQNISGDLIENYNLLWCGTAEPALYVVIQSTQFLNRELNFQGAEAISKCLSYASGVPENR